MKKIIVPIDFSEVSINALNCAIDMAKKMQSTLYLVNICNPKLTNPNLPSSNALNSQLDLHIKATTARLNDLATDTSHNMITVKSSVLVGVFEDEIAKICKKESIDLIITGSKGASGIDAKLFGSNSGNLISNSTIPTWIIPQNFHSSNLKSIIYATDFRGNEIKNINFIKNIATAYNCPIIIAHINTDPLDLNKNEEDLNKLKSQIAKETDLKNVVYTIYQNDSLADGLADLISIHSANLVCMNTRKRGFLQKFFKSSNSKEMAFKAEFPLLVFHSSEN